MWQARDPQPAWPLFDAEAVAVLRGDAQPGAAERLHRDAEPGHAKEKDDILHVGR